MKYTNKLLVINLIFLLITYCWLHYIFDYQTSKLEIVFAMTLTFLSSFIIGEKRKVFANNEMCDIDMLNTAYYLFYGLVFIDYLIILFEKKYSTKSMIFGIVCIVAVVITFFIDSYLNDKARKNIIDNYNKEAEKKKENNATITCVAAFALIVFILMYLTRGISFPERYKNSVYLLLVSIVCLIKMFMIEKNKVKYLRTINIVGIATSVIALFMTTTSAIEENVLITQGILFILMIMLSTTLFLVDSIKYDKIRIGNIN